MTTKSNYELALENYKQDNIDASEVFIDLAIEDEPNKTEVLLLAAEIYRTLDDKEYHDKAIKHARKALTNSASSEQRDKALQELAELYYESGFTKKKDFIKAYNHLQQISDKQQIHNDYLVRVLIKLDKQEELNELINKLMNEQQSPETRIPYILYEDNKIDSAMNYARKTIQAYPKNPEPYQALSEILNNICKENKKITQETLNKNPELKNPLMNSYEQIKTAYTLSNKNPDVIAQLIKTLNLMKENNNFPMNEDIKKYYNELKQNDTKGIYINYIDNTCDIQD